MLMPSRTANSARPHNPLRWLQPCRFRRIRAGQSLSMVRRLEVRFRRLSEIARIFSRSTLVQDGWRTSSRWFLRHTFEVEQVRPRPDDRDEAHHQLFTDRIDRRVGDLSEVLLEIGEQRLSPDQDSAEIGASLPMEPTGFFAGATPSAPSGSSGLPGCNRTPAAYLSSE